MTHFELYELPVTLSPDPARVKQQFYALSRKYHPDLHGQATDAEQADILELSSQVNKAYKVLSDPDQTIKYVLQLKGLLLEEEKYALPPDFLMEMMELNEQVAEVKMDDDQQTVAKIRSSIANVENEVYAPVKDIVEHYQEGVTSEEELLQVKEYYYKKKYLSRILEGLDA